MAQVLAYIPDLLFGSRVQATLAEAGHELVLVADAAGVRECLDAAAVLVVDLTDESSDRTGLVEALYAEGLLAGIVTLGFYSHVEAEVRETAESAGFDLVVPRSRMAREGPSLVAGLLG